MATLGGRLQYSWECNAFNQLKDVVTLSDVNDQKIIALQRRTRSLVQGGIALLVVTLVGGGLFAYTQGWLNFSPAVPVASLQPSEIVSETPSPQWTPEQRQAVQQQLTQLQQRVAGLQQDPAKLAWKATLSDGFVNTMDSLYADYVRGDYQFLEQALSELALAMDQYDQDFLQAISTNHQLAQRHFDQEQIHQARAFNQQTLLLQPEHPEALQLESRLAVFQQIKTLQRGIKRAVAEEQLDEQYRLLKQLLALDSQRQAEQVQYQSVLRQIKQRDFNQKLQQAYMSVTASDLDSAEQFYRQAQAIDPQRPELDTVLQQIKQLRIAQGIDQFHQQLTRLRQQDNWGAIARLTKQGLRQFPNDPRLNADQQLAEAILEAQTVLQIYIDQPQRVFDVNLRKVATEDLATMSQLVSVSPALDTMIEQVEQILMEAKTPVKVWFESDNRTYIRVLQVGKVGELKGRYVQLLPGTYQVEGRREGYKSVIQTLVVKPQGEHRLKLVCNEKI